MRRNFTSIPLIVFLMFFCLTIFAQNEINKYNPWLEAREADIAIDGLQREIIPATCRMVQLDLEQLQVALDEAPPRFSDLARQGLTVLDIPMPDGSMQQFSIADAPIMESELAARYPMIHSYAGKGIDDPSATIRFDITQKGFHALILNSKGESIFIDPYAKEETGYYMSYYKRDYDIKHKDHFTCQFDDHAHNVDLPDNASSYRAGDCSLRIYRLALACTGEYGQFHGGTKADVMAAFNTAMTRVNGLYEREAAISMVLVDNTDELIFLDGDTDPYSNQLIGEMIKENQKTCDDIIQPENYDIGHVFGTGDGGIAGLNAVCGAGKARGATGLPNPVNDGFYIDYVAHEMGHQFGATHTFNNSCGGNTSGLSAYEPGSGSTIMGYAGICAPNVQIKSDAYFHAISLAQIAEFTSNTDCAEIRDINNNAPTVDAGADYVIPNSTSFELTADASDADGNNLTYCWEQMDNEIATMPPLATNTDGPLFRSYTPSEDPNRYFPALVAIRTNSSPQWEVLPTVGRDLNFRCTVRDNATGAGCTAEDDVKITVAENAGPFEVIKPNGGIVWLTGENQSVTWDVANTDQTPVNCSEVDILLSTDDGLTFPIELGTNVPNTGLAYVDVPDTPSSNCRIRIQGSDNVFFDISDVSFQINTPPSATFLLSVLNDSETICKSEGEIVYNISLLSIAGFDEEIALSAEGLPEGTKASFSMETAIAPASVEMTVSNLDAAAAGTYTISILAVGTTIAKTTDVTLDLSEGMASQVSLTNPSDGQTDIIAASAVLDWIASSGVTDYLVEIATSPTFGNSIVESVTVTENTYTPTTLENSTTYYWRVSGNNICGNGEASQVYSFQTAILNCNVYQLSGLPGDIDDAIYSGGLGNPESTNFKFNISQDVEIADMNILVEIEHKYISDIRMTLTSPAGKVITIFDRPGIPDSQFGCSKSNLRATFDDSAVLTGDDLENTCESGGDYAIEGTYQVMIGSLADFNGTSLKGEWLITIYDEFYGDTGRLIAFEFEVCSSDEVVNNPSSSLTSNEILTVPNGQTEIIKKSILETENSGLPASDISYVLLTLPENGIVNNTGKALSIGESFTQADVNTNKVSYTHDGSNTTTDFFEFNIADAYGGLITGNTFNINVLTNTLEATASLVADVDCFGDDNGELTVNASGGTEPYEYSIDGGNNYQEIYIFNNLAADDYTVTVNDASGFTFETNIVTIVEPPLLTIEAKVDGDNITINAEGGTPPFEYSIYGISYIEDNTFTGLSNGTYDLYVRDDNGCIAQTTASVSVAINDLEATANLDKELDCFGDEYATISVDVSGGTAPFEYSIDDGDSYQDENIFDNLAAGEYIIIVKEKESENNFEILTNIIVIEEPDALEASTKTTDDSFTVDVNGGTAPYEYSLDNENFQESPIFSGLANGTYDVYVRDANGCTIMTTGIIDTPENTLELSTTLINNVSCLGEADAAFEVNVNGGTEPFQYSIDGGDSYQPQNVFEDLEAGTYTIQVMDNNDFLLTTEITITEPEALIATSDVNGNVVTINASGGTKPYEYSINGINFQESDVFTNLNAGTFTFTIKDNNDCTTTVQATIEPEEPTLVANAILINDISCFGETDAIISISVTGGTTPYAYSIDNGNTYQEENNFENLSAQIYLIKVKDANEEVINTNTITVREPTELTATNIVDGNTITLKASGGTTPYEYSLDGANQESEIFKELTEGDYTFVITDANGCTTTTIGTILPEVEPLQASAIMTKALECYGDSDGALSVGAIGGYPPYRYSIDDGNTYQNENLFENLTGQTYTVKVQDQEGNTTYSNEVTIIQPEEFTATNSIDEADVTILASGGTAPYTYSLGGVIYQESNVFQNLANGTYEILVQDANGCIIVTFVSVVYVVNSLLVSAEIDNELKCFGDADGRIVVNVTGGTPTYSYSIDDGDTYQQYNIFDDLAAGSYVIKVKDESNTVQIQSTNTIVISEPDELLATSTAIEDVVTVEAEGGVADYEYSLDGINFQEGNIFPSLPNGEYEITVRDANDCITIANAVVVEVLYNTLIVASTLISDVSCFEGESGVIAVTVNGGYPPFEYSIDDGYSYQTNNTFEGLSSGTYTVIVQDSEGFLQITNDVSVSQPDVLNISTEVVDDVIIAMAWGGTAGYEYSIDGENFQTETTFDALANGAYTVTVRDENGCTSTEVAVVAVNSLEASATLVNNITCHDTNDGTIEINAAGGTGEFEYSLDGESFQAENIFTMLTAGQYILTVRDKNNPNFSRTTNAIVITNPAILIADNSVDGDIVEIIVSGGTGAYEYSLNGINFQDGNIFKEMLNGTYEITIRDENGCTTMTTAVVAVNSLAVSANLNKNISCHDLNDGTIEANASGGTGIYEYSLDGENFQTEPIFTMLPAGTYTITIKDEEGFEKMTNPVIITNPDLINAESEVNVNTLTVTASGGTGAYKYSLDGGESFQSENVFYSLPNDEYYVTVKDENLCTFTSTSPETVAVNTLIVSATLMNNISCYDANDGMIQANAGGGTGEYSYSLDGENFQESNLFTMLAAGEYIVTVKDSEDFSLITNTVTITNPTLLEASNEVDANTITVFANGGTGSYLYSLNGGEYQDSNIFADLENGVYEISIKDENDCITITTALISVNNMVVFANIVNEISCYDANDASIEISAAGGQGPYEYSLDGENFQSENAFSMLAAGDYMITVRDNDGLIRETNIVTITNAPIFTATNEVDENMITVLAEGGVGEYEYSLDGQNFQFGNIFANLPNGTYTVIIKDENGCLTNTTATIFVNNLAASAVLSNDISCHDVNDGSIEAIASGGFAPYKYSLDGEDFQETPFFNDLPAGTYTIMVEDANEIAFTTNTVIITNPDPIQAIASTSEDEITVMANGGTGDLSYSIDEGVSFQESATFIDLENGDYTIIIRDENDCMTSITATVSVIPPFVLASSQKNYVTCNGAMDGRIKISVTGGVLPYLYRINGGTYQEDSEFLGLDAGIYIIEIQDGRGEIIATNNITINEPDPLVLVTNVDGNTLTLEADGGTGTIQYTIDGGVTYQEDNVFPNLPEGIYIVGIIDGNGCFELTEVEITDEITSIGNFKLSNTLNVYPNPSTGIFNISLNQETVGNIEVSIFDALGRRVYHQQFDKWNASFEQTIAAENLPTGIYRIKITDGEQVGVQSLSISKR